MCRANMRLSASIRFWNDNLRFALLRIIVFPWRTRWVEPTDGLRLLARRNPGALTIDLILSQFVGLVQRALGLFFQVQLAVGSGWLIIQFPALIQARMQFQ